MVNRSIQTYILNQTSLRRLLTFLLLFPLLITASFAYQAGNNFELTAGTNKVAQSVSSSHHAAPGKKPTDFKSVVPGSPNVPTVALSLLLIYKLVIAAGYLRSYYAQLLRKNLLKPITFTGNLVDGGSK